MTNSEGFDLGPRVAYRYDMIHAAEYSLMHMWADEHIQHKAFLLKLKGAKVKHKSAPITFSPKKTAPKKEAELGNAEA